MASFSAITIDTFLSPFSMLGMYVLSISAINASFSCDRPFSNRRRFKLLPNFCLMSIAQKSLFVENCTTDNRQLFVLFGFIFEKGEFYAVRSNTIVHNGLNKRSADFET